MSQSQPSSVELHQRPAEEQPLQRTVQVGPLTIAYVEWPDDADRRPIVLAHATGFHARTWDAVVRHLGGRRVIAIDLRGHGLSDNPEPPIPWDHFPQDVLAVIEALDLHDVVAVGHSMGGHSVTLAASRAPERFAALLLLDPVMMSAPRETPAQPRPEGAFHFVAKRRNEWTSPEEMVERFRDRFPYNAWQPDVLLDYARYGLVPNPDGPNEAGQGLVLACPPAIEAAIYGGNAQSTVDVEADVLPLVTMPVRVVRARQRKPGEEAPPFSVSPTRPDLASLFADGEDLLMPEMSHFIPMEDPAFVAQQILELELRLG